MAEPLLKANPKRLSKSNEGVDSWYPYYAGFSSDFARAALANLLETPGVVLDPWNGSGTTTWAAQVLGHTGIGVDLNPFAGLVASAKLVELGCLSDALKPAKALLNRRAPARARRSYQKDPLAAWLPPAVGCHLQDLLLDVAGGPLAKRIPAPLESLLCLCLVRAARDLAVVPNSNPTWVTPRSQYRATQPVFRAGFLQEVERLAQDRLQHPHAARPRSGKVLIGDSRSLDLGDESVDVVLGSPPYCTRIDYAVKTSFELAAIGLGSKEKLRQIRQDLMGTTTIRSRKVARIPRWPSSVKALLAQVEGHSSDGSVRYYHKNLCQYFSDAHASVAEIQRVMKRGGAALLVVQNSYYKEINIDLAELFGDLAAEAGLASSVVRDLPVWPVMTNLNPKARKYRQDRTYTESIIRLEKSK